MGILTITRDEFAPTFWQWYEHCNKCVQIEDDFLKKKLRNIHLSNSKRYNFIELFSCTFDSALYICICVSV